MARASRCGLTMLVLFGLMAASIAAIIAMAEGIDVSWVALAVGAPGAPCVWRRLIYTALSPPCDEPVGCTDNGCDGKRKLVGLARTGKVDKQRMW